MQYSVDKVISVRSLSHEKKILALSYTATEVTRLQFHFVCIRYTTFVLAGICY